MGRRAENNLIGAEARVRMRIKEEEGGPIRRMGYLKRVVPIPLKVHMYTRHKGLVRETYMRHFKREAFCIISGSGYEVSMTCLCRRHPACSCC
jgi:hypothetical protein